MTTPATSACDWCETPYRARSSGGREQRFCGERCRRAFHTAVRRWTLGELAAGRLTLANIRNGLPATLTLATDAASSSPIPEEGEAAAARLDELRDLVDDIFVELSSEEAVKLPDPVWTLLGRIIGRDDGIAKQAPKYCNEL
jgi:hypothetical protein